jgi:threonine dehydrogenase-like Zn-dependent dehydrogenase
MESKVVVVHADRKPMEAVVNPLSTQTYCNPRVSIQTRTLGRLHPDAVRVEMIYSGLCGTDVHLLETNPETGYIRCSAPVKIPPEGRILGHEGVGRVIAIGAHVRHIVPGDYVTFESIIICHDCRACRSGHPNQCLRARLLGLEEDGLFGTVVDVLSQIVYEVAALAGTDEGLKAAACSEPAGVGYVACENARVGSGDVVVIFGGGPIGVVCAMLCKKVFGAAVVHLVEPAPFRRTFSQSWSDRVYDIEEFFADPSPPRVDVVIEASGVMDNVRRVFRRLNPNGRVVLLGRSGAPLTLDGMDHMITNAISLTGSRGSLGGAVAKVLSLYASGIIPLDAIVTDVLDGPQKLCGLLKSPERIIDANCKVLVRLNV